MSREGVGAVELREAGGKIHLSVYPSVTESWYDMGGYEEIVRSGAFRRTLGQDPDVILNLEHSGLALASTRPVNGAPTLDLSEAPKGLLGTAELSPDDPDARLLKVKSQQAPLEASFAFRVTRQQWDADFTKREIMEVDLHRGDISIVGRAASPATQGLVDVRGRRGTLEQRRKQAELIGKRFVGIPAVDVGLGMSLGRSRNGGLVPSYASIARAKRARAMAGASSWRASSKYTQAEIDKLGGEGKAFGPDPKGHYSYPCADEDDLRKGIRAVGRGNASHRAIRRFLMKRAKEMGLSKLIPATWRPDGSLRG